MKKLVAVIGYRNSGKSTIIQSLTGCSTKGFCDFVIDEDTKSSVFVVASSPQEDSMTEEKFRQILDSVIAKEGCSGVVIAIQPIRPHTRISMEKIFEIVQQVGGFKVFVFILHPTRDNYDGKAQDIRNRLADFNMEVRVLDARRFSHFNAREIQNVSNILNGSVD